MGEGFSSAFYKQTKKKNDKNEITDIYIYNANVLNDHR